MLIVTRCPGQGIEIGQDIVVEVIEVSIGGRKLAGRAQVRLGITAPVEVPITRDDAKDKGPRPR